MRRGSLTIEARYVFPVEGPPIEDGCLTIEHGRIAWVGSADDRAVDSTSATWRSSPVS